LSHERLESAYGAAGFDSALPGAEESRAGAASWAGQGFIDRILKLTESATEGKCAFRQDPHLGDPE